MEFSMIDAIPPETLSNFTEMASETALKEIVKQSIQSILKHDWQRGTEDGKNILEKLAEEKNLLIYCDRLAKGVVNIRTISSPDTDVHIDKIYTPLHIKKSASQQKTLITDRVRLHPELPINIIGHAGQGKSTILRKLFWEELKVGDRLPIFIELRELKEDTIERYIERQFNNLGFSITQDDIAFLLQSNRSILLLDGFDEIPYKFRKRSLELITQTYTRYNAKIITTSRLDTEIYRASNYSNTEVCKLTTHDIRTIIKKTAASSDLEARLIDCLENNSSIQETLISPILVCLFCITQPHWEYIPKNATDFYKQIFNLLLTRHDLLKNFDRPKKSSITNNRMKEAFSAFCYFSLIDEKATFDRDSLLKFYSESLDYLGIDKDEADFIIDDIIEITCLIMRNGHDTFSFIHRSIQEYHAAHFISKSVPEDSKYSLFEKLSAHFSRTDYLNNLLRFYQEIDKHSFENHFVVNAFKNIGISNNFTHLNNSHFSQSYYDQPLFITILDGRLTPVIDRRVQPAPLKISDLFYSDDLNLNTPLFGTFSTTLNILINEVFNETFNEDVTLKTVLSKLEQAKQSEARLDAVEISIKHFLESTNTLDKSAKRLNEPFSVAYNLVLKKIIKEVNRKNALLDLKP